MAIATAARMRTVNRSSLGIGITIGVTRYARFVRIDITDPADIRLGDYVGLRDVQLRKSLEAERGVFIAEGATIIARAADAGCRPRSFLLAERWLPGLATVCDAWPDVPVYVVTEAFAEQVTGFHVHRGALASFERPAPMPFDELLAARRLVICEDIVDHTNVGAIIRCAAGLGWDGVVLAPRAADPLYRRAIKTSMGTVFGLPWVRMTDSRADLARLREAGFVLAAMALTPDAVALDEFEAPNKLALLMGTEGAGLSPDWLAEADLAVKIPMQRGVDSLNVAAAAAVACYALA